MNWVTIIWSMIAAACLTLGAIYWLAWLRNRAAWSHLLFSTTAASTAVFTFCELRLMQAETPGDLLAAMQWGHVALLIWLVSIIWFVTLYLGTGRRWLAWTICGLRVLYLLPAFLLGRNVNFLEITSLQQVPLLGEPVTIFKGIPNPWSLFGYTTMVMILVFVADASVTAWRRGFRRQALMVGGSAEFFLVIGTLETALIFWANLPLPILLSPLYLGLVAVMGYEVSHDVIRASQLVHELQASEAGLRESEARMSLAVDAANFGIWIRDFARDEIWASERWRELFGFTPAEPLEYDAILKRVHPDDRGTLDHAVTMAVAGADGGRYEVDYRLTLPDGAIRWISSQGRVEHDAAGRPLLTRGAARDVTADKHAENVVRNLSGRLLTAHEEERQRIARELHDNLSQQVALLSIEIEQLAMSSMSDTADAVRQLGVRNAEIAREIHGLAHKLHSTKLRTIGLQAAVRGHCRERLTEGLQVQCQIQDVPGTLSQEIALCLFRIVQEGLNNVVKHSGAQTAEVTLTGAKDSVLLTIADAGRGFDEVAATANGGLGLASMRERMHLVGGDLTFHSQPGRGAMIVARVPVIAEQAAAASPFHAL